MNVLDLTGPVFLQFWGSAAGLLALFSLVRRRTGTNTDPEQEVKTPKLDPYEIAYLEGGAPQVVNAAIASLVHAGVLKHDGRNFVASGELAKGAHRAERAVFDAVALQSGRDITGIRQEAVRNCEEIGDRLRELDLIASDERQARVIAPIRNMWLALLAAGAIKIMVGVSRERPVAFLVIGEIVALLVMMFLCRRLGRTSWGDRVLGDLRITQTPLEATVRSDSAHLEPSDVALAVGLFGVAVLADPALASLGTVLHPPPGASGSCSSGCGSGSSCSGGGGCSSGCGGGCGGCGS